MRSYAQISPRFWIGKTNKTLKEDRDTQLLSLYLMTCPNSNMLGLYYIPIVTISHETGISVEGALKGLQRLFEGGFCTYDEESEHVFVYNMARFQVAESLKEKDNRIKGVQDELNKLSVPRLVRLFYDRYEENFHLDPSKKPSPLEAPSKPLRSQEQEQEQEQEQDNSIVGKNVVEEKPGKKPTTPKKPFVDSDQDQIDSLLERYSLEHLEKIKEALSAIESTRARGKITDGVRLSILKQWDQVVPERVIAGIEKYLDKGCHLDGKSEKYLWGIIRNLKPEDIDTPDPDMDAWQRQMDKLYDDERRARNGTS